MVPRSAVALALGVATAALAGCDHDYVYSPTVATTSAIAGRPASYYAIPPETPQGSVQLATFGIAAIRPQGTGDDRELHAIHMRMIVSNNSSAAWTVDTREQVLSLPGRGTSRPAYAQADAGGGPLVSIPPLGKASIDLFYPLPADMEDAGDVPAFDTLWRVHTDARVVADRTPFERLEVVPRYAYDDYYYGPGAYYDPWYPRGGAFVGVRVSPFYAHHPNTVVIHPHGRR